MPKKEELTPKMREIGLDYVIKDGIASQTMATLTGGVFLVALALELGASNFIIGLLASIPALMQLFQLPASYIVEKIRNRKKISFTYSLISRLFLIGLIIVPFLKNTRFGLLVLIITLSLHGIFAAISACSWNTFRTVCKPSCCHIY